MEGLTGCALRAEHLHQFFHVGDDEVQALRDVSLEVDRGEVLAIVGPSGSGKTTLFACLSGLTEPDGGVVTVAGERLTRRPPAVQAALRSTHIGLLRQDHNLFGHLDVAANLELAQRLAGRPDRLRRAQILDELSIEHTAPLTPDRLSGGEAARAGLAVALVNDPVVLLADEPTGQVDHATRDLIVDLLVARAARARAVIVITHDPEVATRADRVVTMRDGVLRS